MKLSERYGYDDEGGFIFDRYIRVLEEGMEGEEMLPGDVVRRLNALEARIAELDAELEEKSAGIRLLIKGAAIQGDRIAKLKALAAFAWHVGGCPTISNDLDACTCGYERAHLEADDEDTHNIRSWSR